jgi:ribosome modulation factor
MRTSNRFAKKYAAYQDGCEAFRNRKSIDQCPYTNKSYLGIAWRAGWYRTEYYRKNAETPLGETLKGD